MLHIRYIIFFLFLFCLFSSGIVTFLAQETNIDQESIKQLAGWSQIVPSYFHTDNKHKRIATNKVDMQYDNTLQDNNDIYKSSNIIQFPFGNIKKTI